MFDLFVVGWICLLFWWIGFSEFYVGCWMIVFVVDCVYFDVVVVGYLIWGCKGLNFMLRDAEIYLILMCFYGRIVFCVCEFSSVFVWLVNENFGWDKYWHLLSKQLDVVMNLFGFWVFWWVKIKIAVVDDFLRFVDAFIYEILYFCLYMGYVELILMFY